MSLVIPSEIVKNTISAHYPEGYEEKEPDDSDNEKDSDKPSDSQRFRREQTPGPLSYSKYDLSVRGTPSRPHNMGRSRTVSPEDIITAGAIHDLEGQGMSAQDIAIARNERRVTPVQDTSSIHIHDDNGPSGNACAIWFGFMLIGALIYVSVLITQTTGIAEI